MPEGPEQTAGTSLIVGAGAVGTVIAAHLLQAGRPVAFYLRDKDLTAYRDKTELRLERASGAAPLITPAPALVTNLSLAGVENVFICVKYPALAGVIAALPHPLPAGVRLISCLNGVGIAQRLREAFPGANVANLTIMFNAQLPRPLHAQITTRAEVYLASDDPALFELFKGGGMTVRRAAGEAAAWGKLLINLNNAICAVTHCTFKDMLLRKDMTRSFVMVLDESVGVLERAGIAYTLVLPISYPAYRRLLLYGGPLPWWFAKARNGLTAASYPSMVSDIERGRPTEIDQLNGEIVRRGREIDMPTPVNTKVIELLRGMEGRPPERYLTPRELREALVAASRSTG
ncbi:MAG: ketopantoate reductase family protein [Nevskiales bacterium]